MALSQRQMMETYQWRARRYDVTSRLYTVAGFSLDRYRRMAVRALHLKRNDTVVEIGCGTGANFKALHDAVGCGGRIIGVDLSERMLARARSRVEKHGWHNVDLHHVDAASWAFPCGVDGVLSTFALTLLPEYREVIANGSRALQLGGRFVILDFRVPESWPAAFQKMWLNMTRPFGVTLDLAERMPWASLHTHLSRVNVQRLYSGLAYLAWGEMERKKQDGAEDPASPCAGRLVMDGGLERGDGTGIH